jgi:sucrose phosphorylase
VASIEGILEGLYGPERALEIADRIGRSIMKARVHLQAHTAKATGLTERDVALITYGDMVSTPGMTPLRCLSEFLARYISDVISTVHILPFFPYSSDDGFSVIDYGSVDPALGTWDEIEALGRGFRLMFDAVINHVSAQGAWFQGFLNDDPRYRDWFITVEDNPDLSAVVRPRALPLLTRVETAAGPRQVWTTFSADQIDLNYANPDVLVEVLDTLLSYVVHGASLIRLDAIAYLWKEIGTRCVHLPQTHQVIQLFRLALNEVAPWVRLITETNVPHAENISYFGDGTNEAQLVYNFALPPLVMHTLSTGSSAALSGWASGLTLPSDQTAFFNYLASHDGIGLNAARGFLTETEIDALVARAQRHGGKVSYKHNSDGSQSPYELNINYFDALSDPGDPLDVQIGRSLCAHAIMLALAGLPAIYFHSLFGSRGWPDGARLTGRARTINRQKLDLSVLETELADPEGLRGRIFPAMRRMLAARASTPAFHPNGAQQVLDFGDAIFGFVRTSLDGDHRALCLHNITTAPQQVRLPDDWADAVDLLAGRNTGPNIQLDLAPYEVVWMAL